MKYSLSLEHNLTISEREIGLSGVNTHRLDDRLVDLAIAVSQPGFGIRVGRREARDVAVLFRRQEGGRALNVAKCRRIHILPRRVVGNQGL